MSDERLIRLENLRRLVADRGLTAQSLSDKLGSRYSYWHDLLAGQKSFGEKAARRIEDGLDLPRGWLDVRDVANEAATVWVWGNGDFTDDPHEAAFLRSDPTRGHPIAYIRSDIAKAAEFNAYKAGWDDGKHAAQTKEEA